MVGSNTAEINFVAKIFSSLVEAPDLSSRQTQEGIYSAIASSRRVLGTYSDSTFEANSQLPPGIDNDYSHVEEQHFAVDSFLPVRTRDVCRVLKRLKVDSSTGPDGIPTNVLKHCAAELAYPMAFVLRSMVNSGRWPDCWRVHWIVPLYQKKSRADPGNYRGFHLTAQLSTVAKRCIGALFQQYLQDSGANGDRQFAYSKGRGHRHVLALSVLTWLRTGGWKIGCCFLFRC